MQKIGYALVELATGDEIRVASSLPVRLTLDGIGTVDFDQPGQVMPDANAPTHKLVERWADLPPSPLHTLASETASFDGTTLTLTRTWDAPPALTADQLTAYAAGKRRALTGGATLVDVGERNIPCWVDPESRGSATGLVLALNFNPALTVSWKGADGAFYLLATVEIAPLALGMMAFIQTCFAVEAAVLADIASETIASYAEIDVAAWPAGWEA